MKILALFEFIFIIGAILFIASKTKKAFRNVVNGNYWRYCHVISDERSFLLFLHIKITIGC